MLIEKPNITQGKMSKMKSLLLTFLLITSFLTNASGPEGDQPPIPEKPVETSLQLLKHQGKDYFALSYRNSPHWHTYWKNPGDAGLPTEIKPKGFEIKELAWPVPTRYVEKGDILAYGYSGDYTRFFEIVGDVPETIELSSNWLVCRHICIPGKVDIKAAFQGGLLTNSTAKDFIINDDELRLRFASLPEKAPWPETLDIVLKKGEEDNTLVAFYNQTNPAKKDLFHNLGLLTPYRQEIIDIQRETLHKNNKGVLFGKMNIAWDGEYVTPVVPFPADGTFKTPLTISFLYQNLLEGKVQIIEKTFSNFDLTGRESIESLMQNMPLVPTNHDSGSDSEVTPTEVGQEDISTPVEQSSFLSILLFAFLGGLILNIMPCVLPVISLKLFGLVSHSNESNSAIFKHNLFYTLGVLFTFLSLSLVVVALKATGENVGWGFQLQSPIFIAAMVIVLFVFALNLFGLFEFKTPGGKVLGNVKIQEGFIGDFFGGILATVLSTPCSAPFLGTALTFAFTTTTPNIILTFQAIGVGLAFPFLLTGIFPSTVKFLPRPGMWMEHVKKFLGLTLILTSIWLFDVFISLTSGNVPFLKLITALTLIFFAFYYQKNISKKTSWRAVFFALALAPLVSLFINPMTYGGSVSGTSDLIKEKNATGKLAWETWSEDRMQELANQNELVFIDFTAKWCFTCKVNEKVVLETSAFQELVKENNIKLLLGDWTKKDPVIGAYLKKHGYVGVPAYFIQKPDGTLIKLGETISIDKIKKGLL